MHRKFEQQNLTRVGTSHDAKYSYWLAEDMYVYQLNHATNEWQGWLCSLPAWERTFSKCDWIALEAA